MDLLGRWGLALLLGTTIAPTLATQDLFPVTRGGKSGFIDSTGKVVIPLRFHSVSEFHDGRALVSTDSGTRVYIDRTGAIVIRPHFQILSDFSEGLAAVNNGERRNRSIGIVMEPGRWGYIDTTGKLAIPLRFTHAESFSEGLAAIAEGDSGGFIDHGGKVIFRVPLQVTLDFHEGVVLVQNMSGETYYDRTGKRLPTPELGRGQSKSFSQGLAAMEVGDKTGYIDSTGKVVIAARFLDAAEFSEGLAAVAVPIETTWCERDSTGARWGTSKRYGYIDPSGAMVIPPMSDYPGTFSEGLASVSICGKSGFIDHTGKVVIPVRFESVSEFHHGLALIRAADYGAMRLGYIDRTGKVVWEPSR